MSVRLDAEIIRLSGPCGAADAEPLATLLQAKPGRAVDLADAGHLHAAVVQALLAFRPPIAAAAGDPFTRAWLIPLLDRR
jgi:hypothetical protein